MLYLKKGYFFLSFTLFNIALSAAPVSEDAGIEPRSIATLALALRRSDHSARSDPLLSKTIEGTPTLSYRK